MAVIDLSPRLIEHSSVESTLRQTAFNANRYIWFSVSIR